MIPRSDSSPAAGTETASRPFVVLDDVTRNYGETRAVRGVTMDLATAGQIHALVGENGAGKSTCLGMAAGRVAPSSGRIRVDGADLTPGSPRAAKRLGVHAIYQELTILPALTPEANVYLGQDLSAGGWLRERAMRRSYEELCERVGVAPAPSTRAGGLSVADQQTLEILRALVSDARCVLFDEPTASLAQAEREMLFTTMHDLRTKGLALTLVSHNLDEVAEHSDTITVFRDGRIVESRPAVDWSKREIVAAMLGDHTRGAALAAGEHHRRPKAMTSTETVLQVQNLHSPGVLRDVSFDLRRGEVVGIAGLVGSGRTSILRALAGLDPAATGQVRTTHDGVTRVPRSAAEARRRGISLQPEDRKGQGLLLNSNGRDNIALGEWGKGIARWSFISDSRLAGKVAAAAKAVGFNTGRLGEPVRQLSGGNQQKLMIARWIHATHPILLADEPTRGVDVGAKAEILVALQEIVESGRSMIVVSSELEEVIGLSDRVLVVRDGSVIGLLDSAEQTITAERILQLIFDTEPAPPGSDDATGSGS
jgi:ABC-type sugar transport system ATPase subunit